MSDRPAGARPDHDIYTVLIVAATVIVAAATVYLVMRSQELFGSWNPFSGA